jgi:transcriptional regulator with XRE-family HTH domain
VTPFGEKIRELRIRRGKLLKDMASHLGVSSTYLSALEQGKRGKPSWALLQATIGYFNIIWDEAEELKTLASLSDPNVKIDTAHLDAKATLLANRLAKEIGLLSGEDIEAMLIVMDKSKDKKEHNP